MVILHVDSDILVINKPAGLLSIQDGYNRSLPTLASLLSVDYDRIYLVHRLDKDTSGVMVLARTPTSHRELSRQFRARLVKKLYHAVCIGVPPWNEVDLNVPLRVNGDRMHRTVVDRSAGKPALTHVRVLQRSKGLALLEVHPQTGYTHQIRAHLSSAGYPLLGDPLYRFLRSYPGERPDPATFPPFQRTALHAWELSFVHPVSGERVHFHAPYPQDFDGLIRALSDG